MSVISSGALVSCNVQVIEKVPHPPWFQFQFSTKTVITQIPSHHIGNTIKQQQQILNKLSKQKSIYQSPESQNFFSHDRLNDLILLTSKQSYCLEIQIDLKSTILHQRKMSAKHMTDRQWDLVSIDFYKTPFSGESTEPINSNQP